MPRVFKFFKTKQKKRHFTWVTTCNGCVATSVSKVTTVTNDTDVRRPILAKVTLLTTVILVNNFNNIVLITTITFAASVLMVTTITYVTIFYLGDQISWLLQLRESARSALLCRSLLSCLHLPLCIQLLPAYIICSYRHLYIEYICTYSIFPCSLLLSRPVSFTRLSTVSK
jgi:hypothetical protein